MKSPFQQYFLLALIYYICAGFYIYSGIYGELAYFQFEPMDYVVSILKYIFFIVLAFSPLLFLSDYSYIDKLPFFKKKQLSSTIIGLIIVAMFCTFMISVNKMCLSKTYFDSADKYYAKLEAERESMMAEQESILAEQESALKQQQETTNVETTIN